MACCDGDPCNTACSCNGVAGCAAHSVLLHFAKRVVDAFVHRAVHLVLQARRQQTPQRAVQVLQQTRRCQSYGAAVATLCQRCARSQPSPMPHWHSSQKSPVFCLQEQAETKQGRRKSSRRRVCCGRDAYEQGARHECGRQWCRWWCQGCLAAAPCGRRRPCASRISTECASECSLCSGPTASARSRWHCAVRLCRLVPRVLHSHTQHWHHMQIGCHQLRRTLEYVVVAGRTAQAMASRTFMTKRVMIQSATQCAQRRLLSVRSSMLVIDVLSNDVTALAQALADGGGGDVALATCCT